MDSDSNVILLIILKYLLEGTAVAIAANLIPRKKLSTAEILTIGLTAATTFLILDIYAPAVGGSARHGAGFGIGVNTIGGLPLIGKVEGFQSRVGRFNGANRRLPYNRIGRNNSANKIYKNDGFDVDDLEFDHVSNGGRQLTFKQIEKFNGEEEDY